MKQSFFDLSIEQKLKILMASRLILATAMLGGAVLTSFSRLNFYYLIVAIYLLTMIYLLGLKIKRAWVAQAYLQTGLDAIFITGLIHWTGGIESPFIFIYILPIISAAVIISSRASILLAMVSSLSYIFMVKLESYNLIRPFDRDAYLDHGLVTYLLFLHVSLMLIISLLSGYLSESLKRKGKELVELKCFTDEILNNIPDGVIAFDRLNRITYLNHFACKTLEIDDQEKAIGHSLSEFWPVKDKKEMIGFGLLRRQPLFEGETTFHFPKGKEIPVGYVVSKLYYQDGRLKGGVAIFRDLSTLKTMEEAMKRRERFSAIGEMAAELAHEIRNPLSVLTGSLELLKEDLSISKENDALIELILKEAQGLNHIVSDFLRFSRPRKLHLSLYPLNKVVEEALYLLKNHPHFSSNLRIDFNPDHHNHSLARIDADEIRQAFFNLALNSAEAMPNGGDLNIRLEEDISARQIRIYVSDNGPGISLKNRTHLFEPFYTTKERGVGLGLAISNRIIKDHGGELSLQDNNGRGATFMVTLPLTV